MTSSVSGVQFFDAEFSFILRHHLHLMTRVILPDLKLTPKSLQVLTKSGQLSAPNDSQL